MFGQLVQVELPDFISRLVGLKLYDAITTDDCGSRFSPKKCQIKLSFHCKLAWDTLINCKDWQVATQV